MSAWYLKLLTVAFLLAGRTQAGNLDPTNAPGSTMHSLEEIYQKLEAGSFTQFITNTVTVTNTITTFTNALIPKTGQTNSYQVGDDGNYMKGVAWPNPRFTVQTDTNCVLDNMTGLIWARNANLAGIKTWAAAIVYCEGLTYGGHSDWRLPNRRELLSLIDDGRSGLALSNTVGTGPLAVNDPFTGVPNSGCWSSTSDAGDTGNAWGVHMGTGSAFSNGKANLGYVWPVRGGL